MGNQKQEEDEDNKRETAIASTRSLQPNFKPVGVTPQQLSKFQHIGDFNFPRLADSGAAISGANKLQCQQVLEELDVHKRLQLTLELVKKEMEIIKIQESIAKAIEEKISGEQRRYLLNEQLKAIKKVFKGKKMPGCMGAKTRTVKNVWVYKIDPARNLMWVRGQVPGARGNFIFIKDSVYKKLDVSMLPFPTYFTAEDEDETNIGPLVADPWRVDPFMVAD